ncbi:hypothetical protein [Sphingomonas bacterium]|nr:hypothetical protein [Sphingomonas bacterium]
MRHWLLERGFDPDAIRRRALGGVVLGLTVVAVDHVLRMGS